MNAVFDFYKEVNLSLEKIGDKEQSQRHSTFPRGRKI